VPPPPLRPGDPVLIAARRTAIGTAGHALAGMTVVEIAAPLLADLVARTAALDLPVDEVVLGNCLGPGGNVARVSTLAAGLGESVPAVTIDRQCASGLEALVVAARAVGAGDAALVLAGGAESASTAPWRCWPPRPGEQPRRYRRAPFAPPGFPDPDMGAAADDLAQRLGISRRAQDSYAALSHGQAAAAAAAGDFDEELLPLQGLQSDERPRDGLTEGRLSRLRAAFSANGTATAGNSSGISDGAAAVAVTTADRARRAGLPAVRILAAATTAGDPALPGACAAPAARKALQRADITTREVGATEITEAFASVAVAFLDDLELDRDQVCAQGGAIALGHPWGASGAVLLVRLFTRLLAPAGPRFGLAACASGGGLGTAMVLERVG
jgi:acetyl-CoA C-acetyltransferase